MKFITKFAVVYAILGIGLLVAVAVMATVTNGAKLSLTIAGITLQPSEFVKIIYVFCIAGMLSKSTEFSQIVAGLVFVFAVLAAVVHPRLALVQHLIERVGMVLVLREAVDEADGHHVLAAVLQRVDAEHAADVLNVRFAREHGLRDAVAAHRARGGAVREHGVGVAVE